MILLLDNYDSFVHNLARHFRLLGEETVVVRSDAIDADGVADLAPEAVVISPGPCTPAEAGCSVEVVRKLHCRLPMLGVCLGHQAIAAALGGSVVRAPRPVHGSSSLVRHSGDGLFASLPDPLTVGRYHSLVVERESLPPELAITATGDGGMVMALAHRTRPVFGVQFHPESVLTNHGLKLLSNFLTTARETMNQQPAAAKAVEVADA
ncbi:MAG: aminodeoxychorismate/anthranilate synthase component II [Planctomycetota bacterium]